MVLYEKGLGDKIRWEDVGLFNPKTQAHMSAEALAYVTSEPIASWYKDYAQSYRDALAHRIPPYVPPFTLTEADAEAYEKLDARRHELVRRHQIDEAEAVERERDALRGVCVQFAHFDPRARRREPVLLHAQLIVDTKTVLEIQRRLFPPQP